MKICLDIQSAVSQRAGVGRYTYSLAAELSSIAKNCTLEFFYFDFQGKADFPFSGSQKAITWCPGRLAQLAWKTIGWPPFDFFAGKADLYHFPNFILPPIHSGKSVATIHDMTFKRYPDYVEEKNRQYLESKIADTINRADAIITVSEFSAKETVELLGVDSCRVFPILNGISDNFRKVPEKECNQVLKKMGITKPFLLFVGTVEPRKNLPFLIETFEKLSEFDGQLVIAGAAGWKYEPIFKRITSSSRARDIVHIQHAGDKKLMTLYSSASALVFPSFYEGFGFPPLEAMACECPVISSTGGSLPETVRDAGILIDDFEVEQWLNQIRRVLEDSDLVADLREKGLAHIKRFTWNNAARETFDVYRKVLS